MTTTTVEQALCANCGKPLSPYWTQRCEHCKAPMSVARPMAAAPVGVACRNCGHVNDPAAAFCPRCGTPAIATPVQASTLPSAAVAAAPQVANGTPQVVRVIGALVLIGVVLYAAGVFRGTGGTSSSVDQVRVNYSGCWTGNVPGSGGGFTSRTVQGCGGQTFNVSASIVSVEFQKQDDSSNTLTVQLLASGSVVAAEATSAAYGIATVAK